jgi:hypothetical protein
MAFGEARFGVWVGVDKNMAVVKRGEQANMLGLQHAAAEYIAGHIADTDNGKILCLDITTELAKMPLH